MDKCKPLDSGRARRLRRVARFPRWRGGRGLHSSTFRLNVSALCGIGGALGGCVGGVYGVLGVPTVSFLSETAQVELNSGRV
jgi:hypothetical protein